MPVRTVARRSGRLLGLLLGLRLRVVVRLGLGVAVRVVAVVVRLVVVLALEVAPLVLANLLGGEVLRRVRIGRTAGDRVALVLVRIVDLVAGDGHLAVLVVAQRRRAELLLLGPLVVAVLALGAAEGLVLGGVVGPVLEVGRRVALLELLDLLARLLALLFLLLRLLRLLVLVLAAGLGAVVRLARGRIALLALLGLALGGVAAARVGLLVLPLDVLSLVSHQSSSPKTVPGWGTRRAAASFPVACTAGSTTRPSWSSRSERRPPRRCSPRPPRRCATCSAGQTESPRMRAPSRWRPGTAPRCSPRSSRSSSTWPSRSGSCRSRFAAWSWGRGECAPRSSSSAAI